ncbi:MAG: cyclic nucleotide-binding domain-containing protein [Pseudomonadota bacterium]
MLPQAEVDASFTALSRQYRKLVEDVVAKTKAEGQVLTLNNTRDAIAGGLSPQRIYRVDSGTLTVVYDRKLLYTLEAGELLLPDAGLQASATTAVLNYEAEGVVQLTGFDTLQFMQAVFGDREAGRAWTKLLLTQQALMVRCIAAASDRETQATPGFQYFNPGETIIQQGDRADYVFSLFEGEAEVLVDKVVVGQIGEGEIIGALAVLTEQPRSATVRAKLRCAVVKVPRDQFATLIRSNPTMIHSLLVDMAKHIMRLNKQVVDLSVR